MILKKIYKRASVSAILALGAVFLAGCDNGADSELPNYNYEILEAKKTNLLPDELKHEYQIELKGLNELSGISLMPDGKEMLGVDDEGKLYEIHIEKILKELKLEASKRKKRDIDYYYCSVGSSMFKNTGIRHDGMEGISIDPAGNIYIGLEEEDKCVYKTKYVGSEYIEDKNVDKSSNAAFKFTYTCGDNEGAEGITWFKRGNEQGIYIGVQTDCLLFNYSLDGNLRGTPIRLYDAEGMAEEKKANGRKIDEIAGLEFDVKNDRLWVIDSNNFRIYVFNGDGTKLVKSYDLSDIIEDPDNKDHNNPEGLCFDAKRNCLWVCEDINSNSILHKYSFVYK